MQTETYRWGILATGWIAETFTADLKVAGLNVTAVGSRSRDKAQAFADRFGIPHAHGSYEALVADPEVDIIYIATPHPQHVAGALLALEAGKHVLVEKPFTINAAEARKIVAKAQEKNLVVLEAMWTRFLPHMLRIHEILKAGTLGEVRSVSADHRQNLPKDPKNRLNAPELGGGALLDLGVYPVSFAYDILGKPLEVEAKARFTATNVDAETHIIMRHANGTLSSAVTALDCLGKNTAHIFGTKARIDIDDVWYEPTSFRLVDYEGNELESFSRKVDGRGMQFQAIEMEELVRSGRKSCERMPLTQSVEVMETLDEIRKQIGLVYPSEK